MSSESKSPFALDLGTGGASVANSAGVALEDDGGCLPVKDLVELLEVE